jgi:hypothetical protein
LQIDANRRSSSFVRGAARLKINLRLRFQGKPRLYDESQKLAVCDSLSWATLTKPLRWFHGSFALLFSPLFSRHTSNPSGATKNGLSNGTVSNRDFLSEVGLALAARILDWTAGAHLSAKSETVRIAALQPTGRDNRSAGVLACPLAARRRG